MYNKITLLPLEKIKSSLRPDSTTLGLATLLDPIDLGLTTVLDLTHLSMSDPWRLGLACCHTQAT